MTTMFLRASFLTLAIACVSGLCTAIAGTPTPPPTGLPAVITSELPFGPAKPVDAQPESEPSPAPVNPPAAKRDPGPPVADPLDNQSLARQKLLDQLAGQTELAQRAATAGDTATAEAAYQRLLTIPVANADKRNALLQMAAFYRERHMLAKSAVVYEKILGLFPDDPANPTFYFDLGRVYREAGLYDLAISRFYSVLNAAISQNDGQEETRARRNLSLLARFEIAEASYAKGDFAAASKFYSRLQLLELPATDRPTVAFKNAESLFQLGDYSSAAAALRGFIDEFPASSRTSEARNLLARSYQKLKRPREATETVLTLLRLEKKAGDTGELTRWQKETGRQVAQQFYEEGDFRSAVTIYQTLATLDTTADWQWPIVYEIGLCFERLNLPDRAREAYAYLQRPPSGMPKSDDQSDKPLPPALDAIRGMGKWRQEHLAWQQGSEAQLQALLGPTRKDAEALPSPAAPTTAAPTPPRVPQPTPPPLVAKPAASPAPRTP